MAQKAGSCANVVSLMTWIRRQIGGRLPFSVTLI
jgi:hypothetical protein